MWRACAIATPRGLYQAKEFELSFSSSAFADQVRNRTLSLLHKYTTYTARAHRARLLLLLIPGLGRPREIFSCCSVLLLLFSPASASPSQSLSLSLSLSPASPLTPQQRA